MCRNEPSFPRHGLTSTETWKTETYQTWQHGVEMEISWKTEFFTWRTCRDKVIWCVLMWPWLFCCVLYSFNPFSLWMELIRFLTWIESANMLNHSDFRILTFCLFKVSILWIRTGTALLWGSVQNFPIVDMHLVDCNSNHIPQIPKLRKTIGRTEMDPVEWHFCLWRVGQRCRWTSAKCQNCRDG